MSYIENSVFKVEGRELTNSNIFALMALRQAKEDGVAGATFGSPKSLLYLGIYKGEREAVHSDLFSMSFYMESLLASKKRVSEMISDIKDGEINNQMDKVSLLKEARVLENMAEGFSKKLDELEKKYS